MTALKIVGLCVTAALMCAAIKVHKPELAMVLSMASGVLAILWSLEYITDAARQLEALATGAGLTDAACQMMYRACGLALLTDFGAGLCRDAGESTLATRVDFAGRAALLAMTVPLLTGLAAKLAALIP
ncbi:MAG: SpoIIIAC/SpoIIIAD family protein [Clostridia bacterium]